MQVVFDTPMIAHRIHHCFGRHAFGQGGVMGECRVLSLRSAPFAFDAAERDEPGEGRRAFGRRDHAGAAALETVVALFALFMKGQRAGRSRLPSMATTPLAGPSPRPSRKARAKV